MRILLINPPHPAVASRCHRGRMPPLGLLAVGGPLIDDGHTVRLIDAEIKPLSFWEIVDEARIWKPDAIYIGHAGSTSAHPSIARIAVCLKSTLRDVPIIYGGVYPSYHAEEILAAHPEIDIIVRGEGEETGRRLANVLANGESLSGLFGISYRAEGRIVSTPAAETIRCLDEYRVGWELIEDWDQYHYWGVGRAAVVQFSRGCPHQCTYCGQRGFWTKWRHRDPQLIAAEIGWLYRERGVRFIDLADENPTTSRQLWREFLEALIAQNVSVQIVSTIRAADIVRDADILHLYKQAGFARILMGIETTSVETQEKIRKGTTTAVDREAIRLLRKHDILSQVAHIVGFEQETDLDLFRGLRMLLDYDPDQVNAMYVTPHRWTPFYRESLDRQVVEIDRSRWDYRHQVLGTKIPAWRVFVWVKMIEVILQLRPRALWRVLTHRDRAIRKSLRWCYNVGRRAWLFEVREYLLFHSRRVQGVTVAKFWGSPQDHEEQALVPLQPLREKNSV